MLLDLTDPVAHELLIITSSSYPMKSHCAAKPTVKFTATGNSSSASLVLVIRSVPMCPETNSRRGMLRPRLANLAFAVTSPTLTPEGWITTAYKAAETLLPLSSPKQCRSILVIFCLWAVRGLCTVMPVGNPSSHFDTSLINPSGTCISHGIFSSQASR